MAKQAVDVLIQGGKATAAPPLGPALGPLGVNIGQVVAKINEKTASFAGMQVPVKVTVDSKTKEFEITIGTPPASSLLKKESGIQKGSGTPNSTTVADITIDQAIKVAKMKYDDLLGKNIKQKVKEIMGTCNSMGISIDGKKGTKAIADVNAGVYDAQLKD
ncbi:MAG: 50S ribosomal protein L11 [Candidatus Woesearchaeota archaeon]